MTTTKKKYFAWDAGFGASKLFSDFGPSIIQTAVAIEDARRAGAAGALKVAGGDAYHVQIDGGELYAVGAGAWLTGTTGNTYAFNALTSPERLAQLYAGLHESNIDSNEVVSLIVGLPIEAMTNEGMMATIRAGLKAMKRGHLFSVNGKPYCVMIESIRVMAQPAGAYFDFKFPVGEEPRYTKDMLIAVADIGRNTFDLFTGLNGKIVTACVGGAPLGSRYVLDRMMSQRPRGIKSIQQLDAMVRDGKAGKLLTRALLDEWAGAVFSFMLDTLGDLGDYPQIVMTGGGVHMLHDALKPLLKSAGALVHVPDNPVIANARGLYSYLQDKERNNG